MVHTRTGHGEDIPAVIAVKRSRPDESLEGGYLKRNRLAEEAPEADYCADRETGTRSTAATANNSHKNSLEKPAIAPEDVVEPADVNLEQTENTKNINAINNLNYIHVPNETDNLASPVIQTDAANYDPPKVFSNGAILQPTEVASADGETVTSTGATGKGRVRLHEARHTAIDWGLLNGLEDLQKAPCIQVIGSRFIQPSTNSAQTNQCSISGAELVRRTGPPEHISSSKVLADYLRLGKGTSKANGPSRKKLASLVQDCGIEKMKDPPPTTAFTLICEEDVQSLANSIRMLGATHVQHQRAQKAVMGKLEGTEADKLCAIGTTRKVVAVALEQLEEEEVDGMLHGGKHLLAAIWDLISQVLPKA